MNKGKYNFALIIFGTMMGFALVASFGARADEYEGYEWDPEVRAQFDALVAKRLSLSADIGTVINTLKVSTRHQDIFVKALTDLVSMSEEIGQIAGVTVMGNIVDDNYICSEKTNQAEGPEERFWAASF